MTWTAALGFVVLLVSIGLLASFLPSWWSDDIRRRPLATDQPEAPRASIQQYLARRRARTARIAAACGAVLLLVSVFLILQSLDQSYQARFPQTIQVFLAPPGDPAPPKVVVVPPLVPNPVPGPENVGWSWVPSIFGAALLFAILLAGGVFLIARRWLIGGTSLIFAATISSQLYLVREFKVDIGSILKFDSSSQVDAQVLAEVSAQIAALKIDILNQLKTEIARQITQIEANIDLKMDAKVTVMKAALLNELKVELEALVKKIDISIDEPTLNAKIEFYFSKIGALGPEHLGDFVGFERGSTELTADMEKSAAAVCERWRRQAERQDGLVLAVGATDRIPLGGPAQTRYESNFGLARARAERVKSRIVECGIPAAQVLVIVSGPRTTPERKMRPANDVGYPEDRMVDVWAIWSWRGRR